MNNNPNEIEMLDAPTNNNISMGTPIMPNASTLNSGVESLQGPTPVALNNMPDPNLIKKAPDPVVKPKKSNLGKILIIVFATILLIVLGFGGYKLFLVKPMKIYTTVVNEVFKTNSINVLNNITQGEGNLLIESTSGESILTYNIDYKYIFEDEDGQINLNLAKGEKSLLDANLYQKNNKIYLKSSAIGDALIYLTDMIETENIDTNYIISSTKQMINTSLDADNMKRSITSYNGMLSFKNSLTMNNDAIKAYLVSILNQISNNDKLINEFTEDSDSAKELIKSYISVISDDSITFDTININIYTSLFAEKIVGLTVNDNITYINKKDNITFDLKVDNYSLNISGKSNNLNINYKEDNQSVITGTLVESNGMNTLTLNIEGIKIVLNIKDSLNISGTFTLEDGSSFKFSNEFKETTDQKIDKIDVSNARELNDNDLSKLINSLTNTIENTTNNSSTTVNLEDAAKSLVEAGQKAYTNDKNSVSLSSGTLKNYCFDIDYLKNKGYFTEDNLTGSVFIKESGDKYFWLSDGTNYYEAASLEDTSTMTLKSGTAPSNITTCGDYLSIKVMCTDNTCKAK